MRFFARYMILALLATAGLGSNAEAANVVLRRTAGAFFWGPRAVWTDGTTTAIFHPMSEVMTANTLTGVRVSFQLAEPNGSTCRIRPAIRFSNDGVTWDPPQALDATNLPYATNEVPVFGTAYVDINSVPSATARSWVQFGIQAANASAGSASTCNATLRLEVKER